MRDFSIDLIWTKVQIAITAIGGWVGYFVGGIRTAPNTDGKKLGVAHKGDELPFAGEVSDNGWLQVLYKDQKAWVSGKYGRTE